MLKIFGKIGPMLKFKRGMKTLKEMKPKMNMISNTVAPPKHAVEDSHQNISSTQAVGEQNTHNGECVEEVTERETNEEECTDSGTKIHLQSVSGNEVLSASESTENQGCEKIEDNTF